jgi:hypothetical protein
MTQVLSCRNLDALRTIAAAADWNQIRVGFVIWFWADLGIPQNCAGFQVTR